VRASLRNPLLCLLLLALGACSSQVHVSATANVPAQYSHVWITVAALWFNTTAGAGPEDSGWKKFALSTPQTLDLTALNGGTLTALAGALHVPAGSYQELRLLLVDPSAPLVPAAQSAGALTNDEVDYVDSSGLPQRVPLQIPVAAEGIGVSLSFTVQAASNTIPSGSAGLAAITGSSSASNTSVALSFDAARDLVPVSLSGVQAYLLNPHLTGTNLSSVGTIQGSVDVSGVTPDATGAIDVTVSAEQASADGSRFEIVASAPVQSGGAFVLYPLPSSTSTYDLVFHGPGVQSVIVQDVPVSSGAPASASAVQLQNVALATASSFTVNVDPASPLPAGGMALGFYQSLPSGGAPYLIDRVNVDTFSGLLDQDHALPAADIAYGTYAGGSVSLAVNAPVEGAHTYAVATTASSYADGVLGSGGTLVSAPASGTGPQLLSVTAAAVQSGASVDSISGTLSVATPARYDRGELVLTHDGTVIAAAPLDADLAGNQFSGTLAASVPGGGASGSFAPGLYYAEVWLWNSTDPLGTFTREPATAAIDLRAGSVSGVALTVQ